MNDKLRQAAETMLETLAKIKYGLERNRVWGGMGWSYVPIHPTQYLPLADDLEAQMGALHRALADPILDQKANLIADAPDLLEALQLIVDDWEATSGNVDRSRAYVETARTALAKARGE